MITQRRRGRLITSLAALALIAPALAACSSNEGGEPVETETGAEEIQTVVVQLPPVVGSAAVYLAEELGYFEEAGLDVDVSIGQGGAAIAAAVQAGEVNIAQSNYVSLISGISNGLPVSILGEATRGNEGHFGLVVMEDSPIQSGADLKGKNIGVVSTGSWSDLAASARLAEFGISPEEVTFVNVPVANLLPALESGQVDAVNLDEPITSRALAEGKRLVLDGFSGTTEGFASGAMFASSDWAKENPETVRKFVEAIYKAGEVANAEPDRVRSAVQTYTDLTEEQAAALVLPVFATKTDVAKIQEVSDLMLKFGFITSPVDVSTSYFAP